MDVLLSILKNPFFWGLVVGLVFAGMALWGHWKTKRDFARYKKMLSDKMEIESDNHRKLKEEKEKLARENENLRLKVGSGGNHSVRELEREVEIFARAEKSMVVNAPGFAAAWESAKASAHDELVSEERGRSIPKRIFRKFFGSESALSGTDAEQRPSLPDKSGSSSENRRQRSEETAERSS